MDLYNKIKSFLGIPQHRQNPNLDEYRQPPEFWPHEPDDEDCENFPGHFGNSRAFNVFTDPLEIHKYFEQQMSEMLRNFREGFSNFPRIQEIPSEYKDETRDLRDKFLKPGFEKPGKAYPGPDSKQKEDRDIDGQLDMRDLDSVFGKSDQVVPRPRTQFFGQSVVSKTVRNADGSVETHRTVRDNQGNEETTITRKLGDKEYSLTKKRDKDGKEETVENIVNLDESEVGKFFPGQNKMPELDQGPQNSSIYDKFFN